jgi:hypothetical protein
MLQRIRFVLENGKSNMFGGISEVDETYLGGKEGNKHKDKQGISKKLIAVGIVNRDTGEAKLEVSQSTTYLDLAEKVMNNIEVGSNLITDELTSYRALKIYYNHETINHSKGEYVRKESGAYKIHTNSVEGLFSHLKRTMVGTYHWFSKKHASKYLKEVSFRYSTRGVTDETRFCGIFALVNCGLKYKDLIA